MKSYLKYYGLVYIIFIAALVVMGYMYISDLPNVAKEKVGGLPVVVKDTTTDSTKLADLQVIKGTLSPPVDVMKYLNPNPEMVEKGKTIFQTTCSSCHGTEGKGDGVAGAMLNPKPRNFHEFTGWKNGPELNKMYKTINDGIVNTGMASFAQIPPEDRLNIIMYIRTFNPGFPPITKVQLDSIDLVYSLTKGVKMPNQIPVQMAMEKILQQNMQVDDKVKNMAASVQNNKTDSGAVILRNITSSLPKALRVLALDSSWNNNEGALVKIFDNDPVQNGFKARASYLLSQKELAVLHVYLRNLFNTVK
jgi:mono/diheme cytochrome c family protein